MGYVDKTISKNETLIRQAKICKLSFLDRYVAGVLYALAGIFALVCAIASIDPVVLGEASIPMSALAIAGIGAVLIVFIILLAIYRLIQAIGRVEKHAVLPKEVFIRYAWYAFAGIVVGLVTYLINLGVVGDIINAVFGIIFGGLVFTFAILRLIAIKLVITDKRVFGRRNIWLTWSFDLPIDKADNVEVVFSFWGKMFNYGTIVIKSVMGEYVFKYVKAPEEFKNTLIDFAMKSNTNK